jgi:GTPase KRas protein
VNGTEENYRKKVTLEGRETTLDIIDTAGQQEYTQLRDTHLRTGQGFLLCYAINDDTSFTELKELHQAILRLKDGTSKPPFIVVGCKKVYFCVV